MGTDFFYVDPPLFSASSLLWYLHLIVGGHHNSCFSLILSRSFFVISYRNWHGGNRLYLLDHSQNLLKYVSFLICATVCSRSYYMFSNFLSWFRWFRTAWTVVLFSIRNHWQTHGCSAAVWLHCHLFLNLSFWTCDVTNFSKFSGIVILDFQLCPRKS